MPNVNILRINGVDYTLPSGGGGGSATWGSITGTLSSQQDLANALSNKVDKVSGKGLSTNDYTTEEKDKLGRIADGAEVNVQSDWEESDTSSDAYIQHKPTIPTNVSDLTNDSGFITGLVVLTYGSSTWNDFITAFNANKVVFVRCGAGTTPEASTKPILAHLVKVDYYNGNPRYAEFRFDDYVDTKTYANQDDHIRIYKLFTDNGWTLTTVPVAPRIVAGDGINYDWTTSGRERSLTLSLDRASITTVSFEVVQTLPSTGEANVIYLIPKATAQTQNVYDEYIYTNNAWEKIGDTEIDLSVYYSTNDDAETDIAEGDYFPFNDVSDSSKPKKKTLWSNIKAKLKTYFNDFYVAKVSGKGLSTNDYTTADKDKVDALKDLAYIAKDGSSTKYLKGDGTWATFPTIPDVSTKYDSSYSTTAVLEDEDKMPFYDTSADNRRNITWANIKGKLLLYFNDQYVAKVSGKGLSTNDYTTTEKNKLAGIQDSADAVSWTQHLTAGNLSGTLTINGTQYPIYYEKYTAESPWVEYEMPYLDNPEDRYEGVYRFRATSANIHTTNTVEIFSNAPKAVYDSVLIEEGQITVTYRTNQIASTNVVKARVS